MSSAGAKPRAWKCRTGLSRTPRRSVDGWVSMEQLKRDIDRGHKYWMEKQAGASALVVKRRIGRPCNPAVTAAAKEWRSLGCPAHLLNQICVMHGVKAPAVKKRVGRRPERKAA